jgi:hypothetical protein
VAGGHGQGPVAAVDHRACREVWLVDGQPVDEHVDLVAAQRRVRVADTDLV